MNFKNFSAVNRDRCEPKKGFNHLINAWSLSDWFTAVTGELGEAANIAKKLNRVRDGITGNTETEKELRIKLAQEIADVFIYLDLLAQSESIDLEKSVINTFDAKSKQIGYPVILSLEKKKMVKDLGIQTDDDIAEKIKQAIRNGVKIIMLDDISFTPASNTDTEHFQVNISIFDSDKDILKSS